MRGVYRHLWRTYGGMPAVWAGIALTLASHLFLRVIAPLTLAGLVVAITFGGATPASFVYPATVLFAGYVAALFGDVLFVRATDQRYRTLVGDFYTTVMASDPLLLARRSSGELNTMFRDHLDGTINLFRLFRTNLLPASFVSLGCITILASFSPPTAVVFIAALAARSYLAVVELNRGASSRKASKVVYNKLSTIVGDHVALLKLVLASARGNRHLEVIRELAQRESELFGTRHSLGVVFQFVGDLLLGASLVSMLLILWIGVPSGRDLLWQSIVVVIFVMQGIQGAKEVGDVQRRCFEHWSNVRSTLDDLTAAARPLPPAEDGRGPADGAFKFTSVTYAYPRTDPASSRVVLESLDLAVPDRTHFAVVGANGAGKTTIINLLMKFAAPSSGVLSIGGLDAAAIGNRALYSDIGYVPQGNSILHDSIEGNVRFFEPDADQARLGEILELTGVSSVMQLRGAADEDQAVGDKGGQLSGGEQQRIALARALLRPAKLYIFDEPTSAIEAGPATDLLRSIRRFVASSTLVVVTHSPAITELFDHVLRVDGQTAYWEKGDPSAAQFDFDHAGE